MQFTEKGEERDVGVKSQYHPAAATAAAVILCLSTSMSLLLFAVIRAGWLLLSNCHACINRSRFISPRAHGSL